MRRRLRHFGFTLIELLVVMAIISLLISILIPALAGAKERARRVTCLNHQRQFIVAIHLYAENNERKLPSGLSEMGDDEHTPVLHSNIRNALAELIDTHKMLSCPWLKEPFSDPDGWYYDSYGYVIGYNYLGGHTRTPWALFGPVNAQWTSPQRISEDSSQPIITELNAWTPGGRMTFAPHGPRGAILTSGDTKNEALNGAPPKKSVPLAATSAY